MKFIQILEEPIEPGGLVEWVPSVPGGLGGWLDDTRLTSHNHEQHLRDAFDYRVRTRKEGGRESWLGLSINFDEPLSIPAIRAALSQWIDRHEVLRSHVIIKADGLHRLSTPEGTVQLKMGRIGWYTESGPLLEQIAGAFDRAAAPMQWPAYMFATVGRESSFTLLFAADHSLVDGYSLIMAQHELITLYRAARDRTDAALPEVGSYVDFSAQERRLADQAGADHPSVSTWTSFLKAGAGDMPPFQVPGANTAVAEPPDPAVDVPQESLSGVIVDDEAANRFTAVCSEAGGTLTAGILAAFAIVHHRRTDDREFRCVLPRHTRNEQRWLTALGWFVAVAPFCLDMSDSPTFDQAVARATDELKRARQGASLPFLRVADLIGYRGEPQFVISFIDTRYAPGAAEADSGRATVIRSHSYARNEVFIWINRTPSGMRFSARFPQESPAGDVVGPTLVADPEARAGTPPGEIIPNEGPVHAYLHDFAAFVRSVGDASTFSPTV
ncbi:condensation protein [Gordonia sp. 852002-50816_SCH5313054-c]|uniref:condensation domain-containing protein n=1 Tax=unclassified Gordonia (in: high G+C Gram-positive bacteria) TaxID=2657482 RepID=UPI0007EB83B0|nr:MULTISPECIES: condensation domain-containing protein [unclassified Gordonia (in: high G+C Gram-positive bacteria)]OBC07653.1 condensation protein [Gordonia sp. 852002-50816_SCH5313054-a]OBC12552.1 condensation protein [Gordonia sp. 852002-50816_SCH5313054-c]